MVASVSFSFGAVGPHPRLFLTPVVLEKLKAKAASGDADWLALKAQADRYLTYSVLPYQRTGCAPRSICYVYQGGGWLGPIRRLAMAYQITGNRAYADKVMAIMDAANAPFKDHESVEPLSLDRGYPSRSAAFGLALAFDWVYDKLDDTRKADTVNTLNAWFDWYQMSRHAGDVTGLAYGNYFGGDLLGFGAAGYATEGDNPHAVEIQDYMLGLFRNSVPVAFTSGGFAGGYAVESYSYGSHQFSYLIRFMQMVEDNTETDIGLKTYSKRMAQALLYNLKPNRWQATDEGDYPGDFTGVLPGFFPLMLASALEGSTEGGWMQWLYDHLAAPPLGGRVQETEAFGRLLYGDRNRPALDYRTTEPTVYRSSGDEHVYFRSDWTDDAVWASFAAGADRWTGHEAKKAGHISIQRGNDYLLVNSGQWKGPTGVGGNPQTFGLSSWRANTLFFNDFGEYMYTGNAYVGGQGIWGNNAVLAYDHGDNYLYSKADLTTAYEKRPGRERTASRSLQSFIRSFIALGDKYFVVWDRITAFKPSYAKKVFWHFNPTGGVPVRSGKLVQSTIGDSTLFIKTLLPADPLIDVVADGLRSFTDTTPVTYRMEVSDRVAGTTLNALHVIEASANGEPFPDSDPIEVSSGNMAGALIADRTPRAVLFSLDGTPQETLAYHVNYEGTGRHVIVDMVPGAYNIRKDGVEISSMHSTTTAGVLSFEAGGGTFAISMQSQVAGNIAKVSGDLQVGPTEMTLPEPLTVRVVDSNGAGVANIGVQFRVADGRASLSASSVNTDENGLAAVTVSFQSIPGPVTIQAGNLGVVRNPVTFTLAAVERGAGNSNPQISSIVDGSSFLRKALAAGSIVSLFGTNLASRIASAETIPLPTTLGGVTVQTSGINAPLFYVSPFQVNFQLPWELSTLPEATITVVADGAISQPRRIPLAAFSPGVFAVGSTGVPQGAVAITQSDRTRPLLGMVMGEDSCPLYWEGRSAGKSISEDRQK